MAIQKEESAVFQENSSDTDLAREIQNNENALLEKEEFRKLQVNLLNIYKISIKIIRFKIKRNLIVFVASFRRSME